MSAKLIDFLKKIHVDPAVIKKLEGEEEVKLDEISKTYLDSRNAYYESSLLKDKMDTVRAETASGMTLKFIKKVNDFMGMGLTNSKMEEFKELDTFVSEAKKHKKKYEDSIKSESNKGVVEELDKWKLAATEKQGELDKLNSDWDNFKTKTEGEKNSAIRVFKAKEFWNKMVGSDESLADIPGKQFALDSIQEKIFGKYKVMEDGQITNPDGSVASHPEKELAVGTLEDIFPYYKEKAGILKVSNAGGGKKIIHKNAEGKVIAEGFGKKAMDFMEKAQGTK